MSANSVNLPGGSNVIASVGDQSLVMVNGRPVQIDGHVSQNNQQNFQVAVSTGNILSQAGLEKNPANMSLVETLREYGIALTSENVRQAAAYAKALPGSATDKLNLSTVALMLLKGLKQNSAVLVKDYLAQKLSFASILKGVSPELLSEIKLNWQSGKLFARLQQLIADKGLIRPEFKKFEPAEKLVSSLKLQEILSSVESDKKENTFYFQWPLFWADSDIPDTLEGEACFSGSDGSEQGFCLRLLLNPPSLGQVEVALNSISEKLWVHFGCQETVVDDLRSSFGVLHENLIGTGFKEVRITIGKIRKFDSFFLTSRTDSLNKRKSKNQKVDLRI